MDSRDQLAADLKHAVECLIVVADQSDVSRLENIYDPDVVNVRVSDEGDVVRLGRENLLALFRLPSGPHFPTKSSNIHHIDVVGDLGFVLLTRIKDLGSGWEPMFYTLIWRRQDEKWLLWREFVHQRSMPKRS